MLWELQRRLKDGVCRIRIDYLAVDLGSGIEDIFVENRQIDAMVFVEIAEVKKSDN